MKRVAFFIGALTVALNIEGCDGHAMTPIGSVDEGVRLVDSFTGPPEEFQLAVPDSLLDPVGVNMAMITDHVLKRGWEPNGFTQARGYRIYRYKALE